MSNSNFQQIVSWVLMPEQLLLEKRSCPQANHWGRSCKVSSLNVHMHAYFLFWISHFLLLAGILLCCRRSKVSALEPKKELCFLKFLSPVRITDF